MYSSTAIQQARRIRTRAKLSLTCRLAHSLTLFAPPTPLCVQQYSRTAVQRHSALAPAEGYPLKYFLFHRNLQIFFPAQTSHFYLQDSRDTEQSSLIAESAEAAFLEISASLRPNSLQDVLGPNRELQMPFTRNRR